MRIDSTTHMGEEETSLCQLQELAMVIREWLNFKVEPTIFIDEGNVNQSIHTYGITWAQY